MRPTPLLQSQIVFAHSAYVELSVYRASLAASWKKPPLVTEFLYVQPLPVSSGLYCHFNPPLHVMLLLYQRVTNCWKTLSEIANHEFAHETFATSSAGSLVSGGNPYSSAESVA